MTCKSCHLKEQKKNSTRGLCDACTYADDLAKARVRAAEQHKRRTADQVPRNICACGCGQKCRAGATYATTQHREAHERSRRDEHKQPRIYTKPPKGQSLQRVSRAEKRVVEVLPVLDTQAEKERVARLLEKARRERVVCNISRFTDDRECLMEGRG